MGGLSDAVSDNDVDSVSGGEIYTGGTDSVGGGSVIHPQVAGPVEVNRTSGPWGGDTNTECANDYTAHAGGGDSTTGEGSVAGGAVADAPVAHPQVAEPVNPSCNTGAWGGITSTECTHEVSADAGGGQETDGDQSIVGGTIADAPVTFPAQVCGTAPADSPTCCTPSAMTPPTSSAGPPAVSA